MPSRASGNSSCTACASTCAVECRSTASPSGRADGHRLDDVAVGQHVGEVAQLAVDPRDDDGVRAVRRARPRAAPRRSCPARPIARSRRRRRSGGQARWGSSVRGNGPVARVVRPQGARRCYRRPTGRPHGVPRPRHGHRPRTIIPPWRARALPATTSRRSTAPSPRSSSSAPPWATPSSRRRCRRCAPAGPGWCPQPGEQRKLVTALFSDLVDSTPADRAAGRRDDARGDAVLLRPLARRRSRREGGVVEKFIGDAVVGVFGTGRAHEDDAHRAVRAALRMVDDLAALDAEVQREHGVGLRVRVGIDTGEVVLGAVGERGDDGPVVVGETMNRAARLQAAAPVGGVLLSAATARHVRGAFALQRLDAARLKGSTGRSRSTRCTRRTTQGFWPQTRGIEGVTTRTVGREVELGRLRKAFDGRAVRGLLDGGDASSATPGSARPGCSPTSRPGSRGCPTGVWLLRGRAAPHDEAVPYRLLRSVFAERFGVQDTDGPEQVRAALGGRPGGDDRRRRRPTTTPTWWRPGSGFGVGDVPQLEAGAATPRACSAGPGGSLGGLLRPARRPPPRSSCCWRTCTGPTPPAWTGCRRRRPRRRATRCWWSRARVRRCSTGVRPGARGSPAHLAVRLGPAVAPRERRAGARTCCSARAHVPDAGAAARRRRQRGQPVLHRGAGRPG